MSKHSNPDLLNSFADASNDASAGEQANISIFKESMSELFSTKKLPMKTEISKNQVVIFAMADIYKKKYKSKVMSDFVRSYQLNAISIDRKGREDFVSLIRNASAPQEDESNLMSRLFGKK